MVDTTRDRNESTDFHDGLTVDSDLPNKSTILLLPTGWEPGNWDVICQRGKDCQYHVGNRRFRICIENHLDSYINAKTRQEKSAVISSIVSSIKGNANHAGGFIAMDIQHQRYYYVDNKVARDKVGNALRDAIKQRTPKKGMKADFTSSNFSLESSLLWTSRGNSPFGDDNSPFASSGPLFNSQNQTDRGLSYASLEHPHKASILALQTCSSETNPFSGFNDNSQPMATEQGPFTSNHSPWETMDAMDSMDLEPRPLGLLPQEAGSFLLSASFNDANKATQNENPAWCKSMLSGSQINPLDVENRNAEQGQEDTRWYKPQT